MEIDLFAPIVVSGLVERTVQLHEQTQTGHGQTVQLTVWVQPDDSGTVIRERAKHAAIALLERSLAALKAAP